MALSDILHVGHQSYVLVKEIEAIVEDGGSSGIRKLRDQAAEAGRLIDLRHGHAGRSVVITRSDTIYWAAVAAKTLVERVQGSRSR